jgi:hypothetical protein
MPARLRSQPSHEPTLAAFQLRRANIEGLQRDHGLLAAYLEATNKLDWRALHKPMMVNVEARQASSSPLDFRANLVRVP